MKFVSATVAVAIGATASLAQQDPIAARKALMKANGEAAGGLSKMVKGEASFDLDTAKKAFATFEDAAAKMPNLFPSDSKPAVRRPPSQKFGKTPQTSRRGSSSLATTP